MNSGPASTASAALLSDKAFVSTTPVRKLLLTWDMARDPGRRSCIDPLTIEATGHEVVELQEKVNKVLSETLDVLQKRKKLPLGLTLPNTINF